MSVNKGEIRLVDESEELLINQCIKWDRLAQKKLYEKYASRMFTVCFRYSASREEAEDTFHEGFMKVFENLKNFRKEGSLEGWIRKIMVNTALKKFQKNKNALEVIRMDDPKYHGAELNQVSDENILSKIEADRIMHLIEKLPPAYKMVFNLYEFEGYKHQEIAEKLGISEGTSKSNLSRAKAILQNAIMSLNEAKLKAI